MSDVIRVLRLGHRWLGLALVLPVLCMGVTGCILAVTPVFEDLLAPSPSRAAGPVRDIAAILAAAQAAVPQGLAAARLGFGDDARAPVAVTMMRPQQRVAEARVLIDPVSLDVIAVQDHPGRLYAWVHGLHEFLLLPGPVGRSIIGWFGVGLFVLGITGIPLWWPAPGQAKAAFTVSAKARGLRFQRELHGAAGIWLAAMLLVQSLGGMSMAFPETARALLGVAGGVQPRGGGVAETLDIAAVTAAAQARVPHAQLRGVFLPSTAARPVAVRLMPQGSAAGAPPVLVTLSPAGRVLSVQDPRTAPTGAGVLAWMRALHAGDGLGPLWRLMVVAAGAALPVFAVTGLAMWLLRRRNRQRTQRRREAALQEAGI